MKVLSFTGHRPDKVGGYTAKGAAKLEAIATEVLLEEKPDKVIVGMAQGWDIAVAKACIPLGIPFIAAVPFDGFSSQWPAISKKIFNEVLTYAAEIVYTSNPGFQVWKMQHRNKWMVDNSTKTIALWDGTSGGTANTVEYALRVGRELENVWYKYVGEEK